MAVVRSLVLLGALSAMAGASSFVVAQGCTTFGAENTEGGSPPSDASSADGPTGADAMAVPPLPLKCEAGAPIVLRLSDLDQRPPTQQNGGVVAVTTAPPDQVRVLATAIPSKNTDNGARAYASWSRSVIPTTSADLSFDVDVAAAYAGTKLYAEGGCRVGFVNGDGEKTTTQLVFGGNELFLGGRHPVDGGNDGFRNDTPLLRFDAGAAGSGHLRLELAVRPGVLLSRGTLAGNTATTTATLNTPITTVTVDCGIIYADNSDGKGLQVETRNVVLAVCP